MRSPSYKILYQAMQQESPEIAKAMETMSDAVSAAIEILAGQIGPGVGDDPEYVIKVALAIFRDASSNR